MTHFIRKNLDRHLVAIVLGIGLLLLSYSWVQTQQRLSRAEVNNFEGLIRLDYLDNALIFQRDSASSRPMITAPGGFGLLEYSDRDSYLTINGNRISLWNGGDHGYTVDPANHTLYHTIKGEGWTLTKEITLGPGNRQFKLNYYYLNVGTISEVSLSLSHFHYYYLNPVVTAQGFSAEIVAATREQIEGQFDKLPPPRYKINVSKGPELAGWVDYKSYSEPQTSRFGIQNLWTLFEARPVPANERTLIASEVVRWDEQK